MGCIVNGDARRYPGVVKSRVSTEDVEVIGYTKEFEVHAHDDRSPSVRLVSNTHNSQAIEAKYEV